MYKTVVRDTSIPDSDIVASLGCLHGFGQNTNICFFEAAIHHALNGFEITMVDQKGFGFSSGTRAGGFKL